MWSNFLFPLESTCTLGRCNDETRSSLPDHDRNCRFAILGWVQSGVVARERMRSSRTPGEATRLLLSQVQARKWDSAHSLLANSREVGKTAFVRDVAGSNGSLLTYASLEHFDVWPLHNNGREATVRAKLHYSTAVGPLDDVRDLQVEHQGETWRVRWPTTTVAKVAPQVIPVN